MCLCGFEPQTEACPACGRQPPSDPVFSLNGGCVHCRSCPPGTAGVSLPVCPETVDAMRHVALSPPKRIFSFHIPEDAARQLSDVAEAYAAVQLERGFGALDYWKSLKRQ